MLQLTAGSCRNRPSLRVCGDIHRQAITLASASGAADQTEAKIENSRIVAKPATAHLARSRNVVPWRAPPRSGDNRAGALSSAGQNRHRRLPECDGSRHQFCGCTQKISAPPDCGQKCPIWITGFKRRSQRRAGEIRQVGEGRAMKPRSQTDRADHLAAGEDGAPSQRGQCSAQKLGFAEAYRGSVLSTSPGIGGLAAAIDRRQRGWRGGGD